MKIKVDRKNEARIEALLAKANGKAFSYTVAYFSEIERLAERAEAQLEASGLQKKDRRGVQLNYIPAGPGEVYARTAYFINTTRIQLLRGPKDWFLVDIERVKSPAYLDETFTLKIDQVQSETIMKHAVLGYAIAAE